MRKPLLIGLGILLLLALLGGGVLYWLAFAPNTPGFEGERGVKIPPGAGFTTVVDSLEASGLLASRQSFEWFGRLTGWADQVKAGHYTFADGASNRDLLDDIRKGLQDPVRLTIPPGATPERMAEVAAREMAFSQADFLAALRDTAVAAAAGTDTTHLAAYMLPETYFFYWLSDAGTVVRRIKEQFDDFYDRELAAGAERQGLSREDLVNVAAIVEWESHVDAERPRVAGVYLNRLRTPGWRLQADPTVQYAVLAREGRKRRLLYEDYDIDHPYNTYRRDGLPPGPITNPSPSALRAVAGAEDHDYFYFVARGDGSGAHTFSRTLREHNRAAQEFYRQRDARANGGE